MLESTEQATLQLASDEVFDNVFLILVFIHLVKSAQSTHEEGGLDYAIPAVCSIAVIVANVVAAATCKCFGLGC